MTHVIAGVDGSPRSLAALRLAVKEAAWRGAVLEAVSVYAPPQFLEAQPTSAISGTAMWAGVSPTHDAPDTLGERRDRVERQARERAAGMLAQFISSAGVDPDSVSRSVVSDQRPARALVRLSAGAELLVVGSRGRGGFAGLLLGSVSQQCSQHAACPVMIVRSTAVDPG
ncbi:universal stress protein [soil metagenome]